MNFIIVQAKKRRKQGVGNELYQSPGKIRRKQGVVNELYESPGEELEEAGLCQRTQWVCRSVSTNSMRCGGKGP